MFFRKLFIYLKNKRKIRLLKISHRV